MTDGADRAALAVPEARRGPERSRRDRRRWTAAIFVALTLHGVAFFGLGVAPVRRSPAPPPATTGRWVGERVDATIDLLNPEPIFLPTRWNAAAQVTSAGTADAPGDIFGLEKPSLSVPPGQSPPGLVTLPEGVRTAGVAIRRFERPYFSAFAREDEKVAPLPARAALIEVQDAGSGTPLLRLEVPIEAPGEGRTDAEPWPFWEPFDAVVSVEAVGTVGIPLILAPGSGSEEVDRFFRTNLRDLLKADLMLPAGYYRATIGP